MRHLITPTRRLLRRVIIVLLALIASVNLAAFLLTPLLDRYHDELAVLASDRFGTTIRVGELKARWRGFGPELVLKDLRIGDPASGQVLQLAEAGVDFGVWDMIRHLDLSPLRIILRDLEMHLVRHADGRIELLGFEDSGFANQPTGALPFSGRLRLENITVLWEDRRHTLPVQRLEHAQLRLHLWPDSLSLAAHLTLPGDTPGRLRLAADLQLIANDWSGEVYLAGKIPELPRQVAPYLPPPLTLLEGGADFELWSDWQRSRLVSSEGHLTLTTLRLQQGADGAELDLQHASTDFRYQRDGERRQLDLAQLSLERQGRRWPMGDLHLDVDLTTPDKPALRLAADYLRLADLAAMSRPWPLPDDWAALRDGLQPDGELMDLRLRITPNSDPAESLPEWQLSSRFAGVRNQAWGEYPGVENINGRVRGNHEKLQISVSATGSQLDWPALFRAPLPVDNLQGELTWETLPDGGHQLFSQALLIDSPDIRSVSRVRLDIPAEGPMDIDLHSELRDGDGRHTPRYLPTRHMSAELARWLDNAISSGHVPYGTLLLRGPVQDFPFHQTHTGHFEVRFDVTDLTLNYQAGWPPLQIDDAEVVFHNNSLAIELKYGRIYGSEVGGTRARIDSLDPTSPLLLNGKVVGPLKDQLRFLTESPLKKRFGDLAKMLSAKGPAQLDLDLTLVLEDAGQDRLDAVLSLQNAELSLPAQDLTLSQAKGKLHITLDGVQAKGLRATALGRPVQIDVKPDGRHHRLQAQTRMDMATLRIRMPGLPDKLLQGETDLQLTVDIPNQRGGDESALLTLASSLRGLSVELPEPLGKTAEQSRPLSVSIPLNQDSSWIRLRYDSLVDALFRPDGDRIGIQFGGGSAKLPATATLQLRGRLPSLALDPWLVWAEQSQGKDGKLPPLDADLELGRLKLGRAEIDEVKISLSKDTDGWQGQAESARFTGRFRVPGKGSDEPIKLDFSRLAFDLKGDSDSPSTASQDTGKPGDWPAMDLTVESLLINGHDFGRFNTQARHVGQTLTFDPVKLSGPLAQFDGIVQWRGAGTQADTDLVGKLHAPELGRTLAALGYSPQFKKAATDAELHLGWPGNPGAASLATLRGQIALSIAPGQLLELEPGVARAFGLLNFAAIQRRLRLDFSDLFGKGLSFDKISGNFRLIDGNAYTTDLNIVGPSGDILITGRTGLAQQDLYQEVVVTPRFDATLPVAGALAGGPLAGVAVLVAQVVMKDKVDEFNRIKYTVTGSWKDPQVEKAGGGGLSRILEPVTNLFDAEPATEETDDDYPL